MTRRLGEEMHALVERLYPLCRSITGDGVRATLEIVGEYVPLQVHEVPTGHAGARLDRAAGVEHPGRLRRGPRGQPGRRLRRVQPARARLQRAGVGDRCRWPSCAPHLHTLPDQPGLGAVPDQLLQPRRGGSACAQETLDALPDGEYEVRDRLHARRRPPHLRRARGPRAGRRRGARLLPRLPPVAGQRQPGRHRGGDVRWPARWRSATPSTPTGSCSRPARSGRSPGWPATGSGSDRVRHGLVLACAGRPGRADVQAEPARRRGDRPGDARTCWPPPSGPHRDRRTSPRTATTSGSTARPASTCGVGSL